MKQIIEIFLEGENLTLRKLQVFSCEYCEEQIYYRTPSVAAS